MVAVGDWVCSAPTVQTVDELARGEERQPGGDPAHTPATADSSSSSRRRTSARTNERQGGRRERNEDNQLNQQQQTTSTEHRVEISAERQHGRVSDR